MTISNICLRKKVSDGLFCKKKMLPLLLKVSSQQNNMAKKTSIHQLIENHDARNLEQHLIFSYMQRHHIDFDKSSILREYFHNFQENPDIHSAIAPLEILNVKELEHHLELIIPLSDRKLNGAFFTPDYVIDFIINEIQPQEHDTNLDPACGCGAFLVSLTDYYKRTFQKSVRHIVKYNIFGADILDYNIRRTKLILTLYALQHGEHLEDGDFNLYHRDSLRADWAQTFDAVVGNPPYVKFQDLSENNRAYLTTHWETIQGGTFNLYFAFFELGYSLLKPTGKLGYITPNNYFTSLAGESLRRFFHQKKCVARIVDFSHQKVFDAQTYTAITFLNKQPNEAITYDRIKKDYTPSVFLANANGSLNYIEHLNVKKWRLLKSDEQKNISTIETIGTPIGQLFDICVGIATLKDEVFFVDGNAQKNGYFIKKTSNGVFAIEQDIVRSVYKISDFQTQEEANANTRKIICPYTIQGGVATPIPEIEFQEKFPQCYAYLLSEKAVLVQRDKGKVQFEPFYVWGRTQGIARTGEKILNPTFSRHPRFLIAQEESAYFTNGYGIYFKCHQEHDLFSDSTHLIASAGYIDVVQKILNSIIMDYYVSTTSVAIEGGYPCYQKNFIERFTIPELTREEIMFIRNTHTTHLIDEFLIAKYQINLPAPKRVE
jgi:adenine-specific DNA-methyltransferase